MDDTSIDSQYMYQSLCILNEVPVCMFNIAEF